MKKNVIVPLIRILIDDYLFYLNKNYLYDIMNKNLALNRSSLE